MFYTRWKQREVWMKRTAMLLTKLNTPVFWRGPLKRTKMSQIPPFGGGVMGVGCQRGRREKSCFGRTVWKIPGKFSFSFLLLARDTLNSYHHLHHACNRYKNTHVPGQCRTTLERRTASVHFIMRDFSSSVTKVLQSQIVNWLKNQSESSLHCKLT